MFGRDSQIELEHYPFFALWAYRTFVCTAIRFTPFQPVYGLEDVIRIECKILSLKIIIELLLTTSNDEEHYLYLTLLDETHHDVTMANEAHKKHIKTQFN